MYEASIIEGKNYRTGQAFYRWVGTVDARLVWVHKDGRVLSSAEAAKVVSMNIPGMLYKSRSFASRAEAEAAALVVA